MRLEEKIGFRRQFRAEKKLSKHSFRPSEQNQTDLFEKQELAMKSRLKCLAQRKITEGVIVFGRTSLKCRTYVQNALNYIAH